MTLSTSEKIQVGGVLLGLAGIIAGAVLVAPVFAGAGVLGAGAAAVARLTSKKTVGPQPKSGAPEIKPSETYAVSTARYARMKQDAAPASEKKDVA